MALRTITPTHRDFRQISIYVPHDSIFVNVDPIFRQIIGEPIRGQWLDLDRFLVKFLESRSAQIKIAHTTPTKEGEMSEWMGCLLPEITKRGAVGPEEDDGTYY